MKILMLDKRNLVCTYGEKWVWTLRWVKNNIFSKFSHCWDSDEENGRNNFSVKNFYTRDTFQLRTCERIWALTSGEKVFESHEDSILKARFVIARLSETWTNTHENMFRNYFSATGVNFPMKTSLKKTEPQVTENYEFEDRGESKLFWNIWTINILNQGMEWLVVQQINHSQRFDWDLDGRHQICKQQKNVWISRWLKIYSIWWKFWTTRIAIQGAK